MEFGIKIVEGLGVWVITTSGKQSKTDHFQIRYNPIVFLLYESGGCKILQLAVFQMPNRLLLLLTCLDGCHAAAADGGAGTFSRKDIIQNFN